MKTALFINVSIAFILFMGITGMLIGHEYRLDALEHPNTAAGVPASNLTGQTVFVLTVGDYRALHSWGPFSSWQAAYDRLAELGLLGATWEIAPRVIDGPLSTLQAAQP